MSTWLLALIGVRRVLVRAGLLVGSRPDSGRRGGSGQRVPRHAVAAADGVVAGDGGGFGGGGWSGGWAAVGGGGGASGRW